MEKEFKQVRLSQIKKLALKVHLDRVLEELEDDKKVIIMSPSMAKEILYNYLLGYYQVDNPQDEFVKTLDNIARSKKSVCFNFALNHLKNKS